VKFDLSAMIRRLRNPRRKAIPIRDVPPPATLATDLFRALYLPVIDRWTAGAERIVAEYERTLGELRTDSPADVRALIDGLSDELQRLILVLTPRLRDWALRVEQWQRGKWRGGVLSATGVDLQTIIGPEGMAQTLDAIVEWNVSLVRDVSDQARQRIANAVFAGFQRRAPAREIAAEIRDAVAMSRRRSIGIAADQLSKLTAKLDEERRREAGLSVWKWRHSGKMHPRKWHQARDGNLYSDDQTMIGREVDGEAVATPPPDDDLPGIPPWCGCRAQAVVVFD
jgi:uncharacterized protein with gpF-like domain